MPLFSSLTHSPGDPKVLRSGVSSLPTTDRVARYLGWFSLALGLFELAAPARITKALGMEGQENLVRAFGAREIGAGMMSLSVDKQVGLWSRVAGDALDLTALAANAHPNNPKRSAVAVAMAAIGVITLIDLAAAQSTTNMHARSDEPPRDYSGRSGLPKGVAASRGLAARAANNILPA